MHQSVLDHFVDFTRPLEGEVHWMYLDILGLVSTGIGNLIDPVGAALALPWKMPDGSLASHEQVVADWNNLKAQQGLRELHYDYAAPVTKVRLTAEDVAQLVRSKLLTNEVQLKRAFPTWDDWPADAQLAACSMAWAVGSGFPKIFGNFTKFANQHDWSNALLCAKIREEGNPGIVPRNKMNALCLSNAAAVAQYGYDPETLYWPNVAHENHELVHEDAHAAMQDWELRSKQLANVLLQGIDLKHETGDWEHYDGDGKVHSDEEPKTLPSPPEEEPSA
jgi:GH24 family phage-related lysozyme (muramidase)